MNRMLLTTITFPAALIIVLVLAFFAGTGSADDHSTTWDSRRDAARPVPECRCENGCEGLYPCPNHARGIRNRPRDLELLRDISRSETAGRIHASPTAPEWWDAFADRLKAESEENSAQTWTLLFYDDADFTNAYDPLTDFSADAHSDVNVDVLVLQDTNADPARLLYVTQSHTITHLENWGEVNMGAYVTLRDFIAYGKTHYPADRYLLALYDHGGGWAGACTDVTDSGWLSMDDIARAISEAGGVDIICFTAPCLMGAIESTYELRNCVDVYIGSEDLSGYAFWHGIMGEICDVLNDSALLTNADIGDTIIQYVAANTYWPSEWMTMSAVRSSEVGEAALHLDAFSQYVITHMEQMGGDIETARDLAWEFGWGGSYEIPVIDLYDFAAQYAAITSDSFAIQELEDLMDALDQAVIAECHGSAQLRTQGISIYFPRQREEYNEYYPTVSLDFLEDTVWDAFLNAYYNYDIAVLLQHYASSWKGDHAEITWILKDVHPDLELSFEVFRRNGSSEHFETLIDPEIVYEGNEFTLRDYTAKPGETYTYRVVIREEGAVVTSFETELRTPVYALALYQNHPNPFHSTSTITYSLHQSGMVNLQIYDMKGRLIRTLVSAPKTMGEYKVTWDGRSTDGTAVASGIYFVRLESGGQTQTRKIALLK